MREGGREGGREGKRGGDVMIEREGKGRRDGGWRGGLEGGEKRGRRKLGDCVVLW